MTKPKVAIAPNPQPTWRWWHDDAFIAQGKWSKLAVAEVFFAMYLYYWWLIPNTEWPWVTAISFLSVPFLLLRSKTSLKKGVALLKLQQTKDKFFKTETLALLSAMPMLYLGLDYLLSNYLAGHWLLGHDGWALFWRCVLLGALAAAGAIVLVRARKVRVIAILLFLSVLLGFIVSVAYIRLRATLPNLKAGVKSFSHNLYEAVLVSDIRHSPALLPGAGRVHSSYNLATHKITTQANWFELMSDGLFMAAITVVATLYRWNIKANAWIWLPLAYLLRQIQWEANPLEPNLPNDDRRTSSAFWSDGFVLSAMTPAILSFAAYLIYPHLPADILSELPNWVKKLVVYFPPNIFSIRYGLAVALLLALSYQFYRAYRMYSQYKEQNAKSEAHQKMTPAVAHKYDKTAKQLVRSRWLTFTCFWLLIYAVVIKLAIERAPNAWGAVVWDWLRPIL